MQLRPATLASTFSSDARVAALTARQAGFAGLLFDAYSPTLSFCDLSLTGRREFRHVLGSHQIELVGLQGDLGANGLGPKADIDRVVDRIDRAMEAAAGLTAPLLCLELGPLAEPPRTSAPRPAITPEQAGLIILPATVAPPEPQPSTPAVVDTALMNSVNNAIAEICSRADRYSVTLALRSSLSSFAAIEQTIASARCPWVGVDLDPVSMLTDDWNIDEIFSRLGPLIRHVRGRDAAVGADRRTKPAIIGQGSVDWDALLAHLDDSGYHGWITVDALDLTDRPAAAVAGIQSLKSMIA